MEAQSCFHKIADLSLQNKNFWDIWSNHPKVFLYQLEQIKMQKNRNWAADIQ